MSISAEGRTEDVTVSLGQYILIECEDDDNPYVAQLLNLYTDGTIVSFKKKKNQNISTVKQQSVFVNVKFVPRFRKDEDCCSAVVCADV